MRSSGPASAISRGTSSTMHSTPRASAITFACGREIGCDDERADLAERRIAQRLLAVAHDLVDRRGNRTHALDLDERDPAVGVAAPEIDGPDVGEPLALDHGEAGLDQVRGAREVLVQLALLSLALEQGGVGQRVALVAVHLLDDDRQRLVGGRPVDADDGVLLAHARRPGHVVDRLGALERVHGDRAVLLEQHDAIARREARREAAGVADRAAADENSHGRGR